MSFGIYKFLAFVLSPPAVALYIVTFLSFFSPIELGIGTLPSMVFGSFFLFLIPLASILYFGKRDIHFEKRETRTAPYILSIIGYVAASIVFWLLGSEVLFLLSLSYNLVTIAITVVNLFWKVSAHTAGVAGPITALVFMFGMGWATLYLLLPIVFIDRIMLKAHSLLQLAAGTLMSVVITILTYGFLW